ncbi:putative signal transduction protein [Desulfobulbus propionicus DSM 2032]|jgi:HD-like signal output (HDOD) protein|uniref:Signal transduction protein n=1 Tax=Desulfobulbus propionicus (strain ATCC 33891 / DSM 2032 / VKM B-1956 / 1pr3) TaxID=577650 RepID=A0A7U3YPU0_DESPD|nr:HDOD domain-containing protein [Desulfobulbus propionicus]ADW19337.1 putative signal transduction protein [Desulfobulbus propionicus DSM 2032]
MTNERTFVALLKKYIESERLSLPVFNPVSLRIQRELIKKEPDFRIVEKLISGDQALSSNLLKVANSSMYRGFVLVTTVRSALVRLGLSEVSRIVLVDISKNMFSCRDGQLNEIMKKLWQHSLGCAFAAGMLSNRLDFGVMQHEAFSAGLFHDIGKLLILKVFAEKKRKKQALQVPQELLLGAMDLLHAEQGYLLLRQISMPEMFAVVARDHDLPEFDAENYVLLLVRMANHICHQMGIGLAHAPSLALLQLHEAVALKLTSAELENVQQFLRTTPSLFE